jgi:hypothetical protein
MKHPTPEQLTGFHDGLVDAATLIAVEEHLNECAECHEALAALERQDRALARALTHDPGEGYFEVLAARIDERIAADARGAKAQRAVPAARGAAPARGAAGGPDAARGGAGQRGSKPRREWFADPGSWLRSLRVAEWGERAGEFFSWLLRPVHPWHNSHARRMLDSLRRVPIPAWAGSVAAIIVAVGLMLVSPTRGPGPAHRDYALERRAGQSAEGSREADASRDAMRAGETRETGKRARSDAQAKAPPAGTLAKQRAAAPGAPLASAPAPGAGTPTAGAGRKAEGATARANIARTETGADARAQRQQGFAQPPLRQPVTQAEDGVVTQKPRAQPLDEKMAKREDLAPERQAPPPTSRSLAPEAAASGAAAGSESAAKSVAERETAAAAPAPVPSAAADRLAAPGEPSSVRLCGEVKDTSGRPIPLASVTLATIGRGVSTDAQGKFCIETPPGEHALTVMAVGFNPLYREVSVTHGAAPVSVTLQAVAIIEESPSRAMARGRESRLYGGIPQTGSPGGTTFAIPDSLQPVAGRAARLSLAAERSPSVSRYEAAAAEWERVRDRAPEGPLALEARFRIGEARFHAWELGPSAKRAAAANEALTSYLVRAPLGVRRDRASDWLGRVK